MRYRDPPEVLQAIELAKRGNDNRQWREVHKQRKKHGKGGRMKGSARFYMEIGRHTVRGSNSGGVNVVGGGRCLRPGLRRSCRT